jgi:hypothetical protein
MRVRVLFVTTALLAGAVPASAAENEVDPSIADGSAQRALDSARARWREHGPRNYRYRVRLGCFCTPDALEPRNFVVRGGKPRHPPKGWKYASTAPRLLKLVQEAIDDRPQHLFVRYRKNGLLKELSVDRSEMIADEEYSYFVDRFSSP